jgi:hypothetical protein
MYRWVSLSACLRQEGREVVPDATVIKGRADLQVYYW